MKCTSWKVFPVSRYRNNSQYMLIRQENVDKKSQPLSLKRLMLIYTNKLGLTKPNFKDFYVSTIFIVDYTLILLFTLTSSYHSQWQPFSVKYLPENEKCWVQSAFIVVFVLKYKPKHCLKHKKVLKTGIFEYFILFLIEISMQRNVKISAFYSLSS